MADNPTTADGLITDSHRRNDLHGFKAHEELNLEIQYRNSKTCRVCGDDIGTREEEEVFVACYECGLRVCQHCYEYERREGNQKCPLCNTSYKRYKVLSRVTGDVEDGDSENEFKRKKHPEMSEESDDPTQKLQQSGDTLSSFGGSVLEKDNDGEKDLDNSYSRRKERAETWKINQKKKGFIDREDRLDDVDTLYDFFQL